MIYQLMVGFHVEGEVRDKMSEEQESERLRLTNVTTNDNPKEATKEMLWVCSDSVNIGTPAFRPFNWFFQTNLHSYWDVSWDSCAFVKAGHSLYIAILIVIYCRGAIEYRCSGEECNFQHTEFFEKMKI